MTHDQLGATLMRRRYEYICPVCGQHNRYNIFLPPREPDVMFECQNKRCGCRFLELVVAKFGQDVGRAR